MFVGPAGSLAFAVRKGDTALLAALDSYVENLHRAGSWNRLVIEYFGENAPEILRRARAE
jgi:ABC-type amino acid transport substrate-binding protein